MVFINRCHLLVNGNSLIFDTVKLDTNVQNLILKLVHIEEQSQSCVLG